MGQWTDGGRLILVRADLGDGVYGDDADGRLDGNIGYTHSVCVSNADCKT